MHGFVFLVMGYRGKKAATFKEAYIRRFNEMEEFIKYLLEARSEFPLLTANIQLIKENPKPYHFSNECDMLNHIVLVSLFILFLVVAIYCFVSFLTFIQLYVSHSPSVPGLISYLLGSLLGTWFHVLRGFRRYLRFRNTIFYSLRLQ